MKVIIGAALLCFNLCSSSFELKAANIVAPNGLENADGNSNNVAPFSAGLFGLSNNSRYQQVYAANQFGPARSIFQISSIAFRLDAGDAPGPESDSYNIQVDLSTTGLSPNGLSSTFANNVRIG